MRFNCFRLAEICVLFVLQKHRLSFNSLGIYIGCLHLIAQMILIATFKREPLRLFPTFSVVFQSEKKSMPTDHNGPKLFDNGQTSIMSTFLPKCVAKKPVL